MMVWRMKRFVEVEDRSQGILFPAHLDDYIDEENPVRVMVHSHFCG
jgi:hypothetical protein